MQTINTTDLAAVSGGIITPHHPEAPSAPGNLGDLATVKPPLEAVRSNLGDKAKVQPPLPAVPGGLGDFIRGGGRDWYPTR